MEPDSTSQAYIAAVRKEKRKEVDQKKQDLKAKEDIKNEKNELKHEQKEKEVTSAVPDAAAKVKVVAREEGKGCAAHFGATVSPMRFMSGQSRYVVPEHRICSESAPLCKGFVAGHFYGKCSTVERQNRFWGEHAKGKSAMIVGLAHNLAGTLRNTIEYIEGVGEMFDSYAVTILENDSGDDTKQLLMDWAKSNGNVNLDMGIYHVGGRPNIHSMGHLRNRLLELAWENDHRKRSKGDKGADVVIAVDLDIEAIDLKGLDRAVGMVLNDGYVGATANGAWSNGKYYDIFALRNCVTKWDARKGVMYLQDMAYTKSFQRVYPSDVPPVPVDSAFSGGAVYLAAAVFGNSSQEYLRFGGSQEASESIRDTAGIEQYSPSFKIGMDGSFPCSYGAGGHEDCEHIPFSVCLNGRAKARGLKSIHMLPSWGVRYGRHTGKEIMTSSAPWEVTAPSSDANHEEDVEWQHGAVQCPIKNDGIDPNRRSHSSDDVTLDMHQETVPQNVGRRGRIIPFNQ